MMCYTTWSDLYDIILFQLHRAERAYLLYKDRPVYMYALNIWKANILLRDIICTNIHLIPGQLKDRCMDLVIHIDCWENQFSALENEIKPLIADRFIFERFPDAPPFPGGIKEAFVKLKPQK